MKSYISKDNKIMGGVPVIKDSRVAISSIIHLMARGKTIEEITTLYYPFLKKYNLKKALQEHAEKVKDY